jgi:NAD(P)-dependent dehydrogenase (short-subunit alcohol dehydrogenase family)
MNDDRIALVTGAGRGIGVAIADGLAARGFTVWRATRDGRDGLALDLDDPGAIARAVAQVQAAHGRLDVLVNNAAVNADLDGPEPRPLGDATAAELEQTLRTNVVGPYALTIAALPLLRASSAARVVNLTTGLAGVRALEDPASRAATRRLYTYTTSKAALNALTLLLAHALRDERILVNAADPGFVATDMNHHAGILSVEQGAAPAIALATLPDDGPTGMLFGQDGPQPW